MRRQLLVLVAVLAGGTCWAWAQGISTRSRAEVEQYARQRGWPLRMARSNGGFATLRAVDRGRPIYYLTHNIDAADSIGVDECWSGGSGGLNLTGAGVRLGVWDGGGVCVGHSEFQGRATQKDGAEPVEDAGWHASHATHVAGTMIAGGTWPGYGTYPAGVSRGMARQATVDCYDWYDDEAEMRIAAAGGLQVSNHSYGPVSGWYPYWDDGQLWWAWFGDITVSAQEDYLFGRYDEDSQRWDDIAHTAPLYLFVCSAGNERTDTGPAAGEYHYYWDPSTQDWELSTLTRNPDGPYDCISGPAIAKNGLTVGAVEDVPGGYTQATVVRMTEFSSWGPADDGRIKPDVVGNGYELFSPCWVGGGDPWWVSMSGTSMASPNVSGALALLIQHWRETHPAAGALRSATMKAILIHTADECGTADGPDYAFGWGLVNTLHAVQVMAPAQSVFERVRQEILPGGGSYTLAVPIQSADEPLRATVCWTDPPGTPPTDAVDNPAKLLVNDLDLRIESPTGEIFLPWVLNRASPSQAATTGDNSVDNVEQVIVAAPFKGLYLLHVTHKGTLSGSSQSFSLVVSGAISGDCNDNDVPDHCDVDCGLPGCEQYDCGHSGDCDGNLIPDECEVGLVPVIQRQPVSVQCCAEETATFNVLAAGAEPLEYRWRKDGQLIDGATAPTYRLANVTPAAAGMYDVVVSNECGEAISEPATLTVSDCPPTVPKAKSPQANQRGLSVDVVLEWQPALRATQYDVYFGPTRPPALQAHVTGTQWSPGQLHYGLSYYWRIVARNDVGATESPEWWFVTEYEPTLPPSELSAPTPADGALAVPVAVHLAWSGGVPASSYQVLMGPEADQLVFEGGGTWVGLDPPNLTAGTKYYWQVIAVNEDQRTEGPVWSFKTAGAAPVDPNEADPNETEPNEPNVPTVDPNDPNDPNNVGTPTDGDPNDAGDPNQVQRVLSDVCPTTAATLVSLTLAGFFATRPRGRRLPR